MDRPHKKPTGRKVYIKGEDIRAYGYTIGCPTSDHERRYGSGRTIKGHSDACRARIVTELTKTPQGSVVFRQQSTASIAPLLGKWKNRIRCRQSTGGEAMIWLRLHLMPI